MWHESVEKLLQKYADESQIREAIHRRAFYYYQKAQTAFQLPIIIISAISGSLQFLSKSFPDYENAIITTTATLSIGTSIISSIMTYLKLGESKKSNETAQIEWMNFYNHVRYQLSLSRELRDDPQKFLEDVKQNYQRLYEISPIVPSQFISKVKKRVQSSATEQFSIPMYLNGFHHTPVWNEDDEYVDNSEG